MLFVLDGVIVDGHGRPCERAAILRVCEQPCLPVSNRSTYSLLEVQARKGADGAAVFEDALWLELDNFKLHEVNLNPEIRATWDSLAGTPIASNRLRLELKGNWSENDTLDDVTQRFTLRYNVWLHETAFNEVTMVRRNVAVRWNFGAFQCSVLLQLTTKPNPFMVDVEGGNPGWLSTDLRVFRVVEGGVRPSGVPRLPSTSEHPINYLRAVLAVYNSYPNNSNHPFRQLAVDQNASALDLRSKIRERRVLNFVIAKVRYIAQGRNAEKVRVFFRMFNTLSPTLEFNTTTKYRRQGSGPNAVPLLGHVGPALVSIPFLESVRVTPGSSMTAQPPDPARDIPAAGPAETTAYFGAWLDVNQNVPHFPPFFLSDGPFGPGTSQPIKALVRGYHQCLVAEVHFEDDPILPEATPASSDNLSQRNLAWVPAAGSGSLAAGASAARTVQTTFVARPSPFPSDSLKPMFVVPFGRVLRTQVQEGRKRADELVFDGSQLAPGSRVTVYMPSVDVDEVLALMAARSSPVKPARMDDHTISFEVRSVAYLPLPGGRTQLIPGLLSVQLPEEIRNGESYRLVVHQVSTKGDMSHFETVRQTIGAFQLEAPVLEDSELLEGERIKLSILRWVSEQIHGEDPWRPVFVRYLREIAERVRAFGGDPDLVRPSPDGEG